MKPLSYSDKIALYLHENKGEWHLMHSLTHLNTKWGFVGPSVERRLREISADGYHVYNGQKYYIEQKFERGMIYYRCTGAVPNSKEPTQPSLISVPKDYSFNN